MVYKTNFYDIEVLINFFCVTFKDRDTKNYKIFKIHNSINELDNLYDFLSTENLFLIGYNNINYDSQIIELLLRNKNKWYKTNPDIKDLLDTIYQESQEVIERLFPKIPEWKLSIVQLDLYRVWHYDNKNKYQSLKGVANGIRFSNIQDSPFHHTHYVLESEINDIIQYNINDVDVTEEFYWITKGQTDLPIYRGNDKIQLRKDIANEYNLSCLNWNDVKIGDEINKKTYLDLSNKNWTRDLKGRNTIRSEIKLSDCIASFVKFETDTLNNVLNWLKSKTISSIKGEISKTISFANNKFVLKQGGIHTLDLPKSIVPKDDEIILDFDIDSQYPATILKLELYPEHLDKHWLDGYKQTFNKRIFAKKNRKLDKKYDTINQALKLALNGGYGKTGEEKSWQYDKIVPTKVTVNCQLLILMIVEKLALNSIEIISTNTDGVTIRTKKENLSKVRSIFSKFTEDLGYTFEETEYKLVVRTSVNDYIALKSNNTIKVKGDFEIDKEIHKNPSNRIRAIALAKYFVDNIPIEETINNPLPEYKIGNDIFKGYDIYDYCLFIKSKSNSYFNLDIPIENSFMYKTVLLPKHVRYYVSDNGGKLTRHYTSKVNVEGINNGYKAILANKINSINIKDYDINYQFYIDECNKIIEKVNYIPVKKYTGKINKKKQDYTKQLSLFDL